MTDDEIRDAVKRETERILRLGEPIAFSALASRAVQVVPRDDWHKTLVDGHRVVDQHVQTMRKAGNIVTLRYDGVQKWRMA